MKFSYKNVSPGIIRPIIPIQIQYKNSAPINYEVLVDSGADICIFDAEIGKLIGVDIYSGERKEVRGITGKREPYYMHELLIKVGGWGYKIKAGFMNNPGSGWYGVVGQKGFFDLFKVTFDYKNSEIEVKKQT